MKLARPVVVLRDPFHNAEQLRRAMGDAGWSAEALGTFFGRAVVLDTPLVKVNATEIRGLKTFRRAIKQVKEEQGEWVVIVVLRNFIFRSGVPSYSSSAQSQGSPSNGVATSPILV